jgi:hypothetical protein
MATRLVPFQEGMKVGFGYDLVQGAPLSSPAVQGTVSSIQGAGGQEVVSHNVRITDLDTLHKTLGVNVDAGGSYFGASGDVKVNYASECNVSQFSTTVMIGLSVVDAFENFDAPVLTSDASDLLATNNSLRFRQRFGDVFIDGLRKGGEYFAVYEINSVDTSTREDIAVHIEAAFDSGVFAAHLDSDIATSTARTSSHCEVKTHVFQNGAIDHTDQSLAEIMQKAHDFPPTVAGPLAAPFAVSLEDYVTLKLPNDQFNFLDIQNQRDVLAEHAKKRFDFLTLRNDISYVRLHLQDFIGADDATLAGQLAKVTDDINVMEAEASACLRNPGACAFTSFDVSDFPLPPAKPPVRGTVVIPNWVGLDSREVSFGHDGRGAANDPNIPSAGDLGLTVTFIVAPNSQPPPFDTEVVVSTVPPVGASVPVGTMVIVNVFGESA